MAFMTCGFSDFLTIAISIQIGDKAIKNRLISSIDQWRTDLCKFSYTICIIPQICAKTLTNSMHANWVCQGCLMAVRQAFHLRNWEQRRERKTTRSSRIKITKHVVHLERVAKKRTRDKEKTIKPKLVYTELIARRNHVKFNIIKSISSISKEDKKIRLDTWHRHMENVRLETNFSRIETRF